MAPSYYTALQTKSALTDTCSTYCRNEPLHTYYFHHSHDTPGWGRFNLVARLQRTDRTIQLSAYRTLAASSHQGPAGAPGHINALRQLSAPYSASYSLSLRLFCRLSPNSPAPSR
ncbi:hypothetical protein XENTR_v10015979 [Xenopus tropicalis]|nr:hypothetical protein XENTR_v10015979 [Xenopus tropicalis]